MKLFLKFELREKDICQSHVTPIGQSQSYVSFILLFFFVLRFFRSKSKNAPLEWQNFFLEKKEASLCVHLPFHLSLHNLSALTAGYIGWLRRSSELTTDRKPQEAWLETATDQRNSKPTLRESYGLVEMEKAENDSCDYVILF